MANEQFKIRKGPSAGLDTTNVPIVNGQLLIETDTGKMYLDDSDNRLPLAPEGGITNIDYSSLHRGVYGIETNGKDGILMTYPRYVYDINDYQYKDNEAYGYFYCFTFHKDLREQQKNGSIFLKISYDNEWGIFHISWTITQVTENGETSYAIKESSQGWVMTSTNFDKTTFVGQLGGRGSSIRVGGSIINNEQYSTVIGDYMVFVEEDHPTYVEILSDMTLPTEYEKYELRDENFRHNSSNFWPINASGYCASHSWTINTSDGLGAWRSLPLQRRKELLDSVMPLGYKEIEYFLDEPNVATLGHSERLYTWSGISEQTRMIEGHFSNSAPGSLEWKADVFNGNKVNIGTLEIKMSTNYVPAVSHVDITKSSIKWTASEFCPESFNINDIISLWIYSVPNRNNVNGHGCWQLVKKANAGDITCSIIIQSATNHTITYHVNDTSATISHMAYDTSYSTASIIIDSVNLGKNNMITASYGITLGYNNTASQYGATAIGMDNKAAGAYSTMLGIGNNSDNTNGNGVTIVGRYGVIRNANGLDEGTNGDAFIVGGGYKQNGTWQSANAMRVTQTGNAYAANWNTSGADYAEFIKEWADGNPNSEDRVGYMVTIKNNKLEKANENDYIIGITSGNPAIIGNADESYYWMYERDIFNRIAYEDVTISKTIINDDGEEVTQNIIVKQPKISENYDPSLRTSYVERKNRPEWDYVGMRGVVPVRDDGTCVAGGFCKCGGNGIATYASEQGFNTYYVIERISENVVSVEVK